MLLQSLSETFEADVYDELLTQAEIQGHVSAANRTAALSRLHAALTEQSGPSLLTALSSPALSLQVSSAQQPRSQPAGQ